MTTLDTGTEDLRAEIDGGVAVITMNRPGRRNAFSQAMLSAMAAVLAQVETDDSVGCVVPTGAGGAFCAGGDVKSMAASRPPKRSWINANRASRAGRPYSWPMTGDAVPVDRGDDAAARGELRASHEDRDETVEQLRVAAGDGRLTAGELDQRIEAALTARTYGELAALTADLPGGSASGIATTAAARPAGVARIDEGSGTARRDGRWIVPRELEVRVASGRVVLDFSDAVVRHPAVRVDVDVRSGSLVIVTRPGMVVDAGNVAVRNGEVKVRSAWGQQEPITLRIDLTGTVGSGNITVRPPRRTFPQWLRRMRQHLADK